MQVAPYIRKVIVFDGHTHADDGGNFWLDEAARHAARHNIPFVSGCGDDWSWSGGINGKIVSPCRAHESTCVSCCTAALCCQGAFVVTRLGWHIADSPAMCAGGIAVDSNVSPPHDFAPRDENWAPNLLWASGTVHCACDAASLTTCASGSEAVSRHLGVAHNAFMLTSC